MQKFLTMGRMEWMDGESKCEVFEDGEAVHFDAQEMVDNMTTEELIECVGNIIYAATHDFEFTSVVVFDVARAYGVLSSLNYGLPEMRRCFEGEFEDFKFK